MTIDSVLAAAFLAIVFMGIGAAAARYHYSAVIAGYRCAVEDLQEYIRDHSDVDAEANAEDLWGHG